MPQRTVSYRPQTSRQAKRAYQKAGATPRISAAEQRRIDRAAELEERRARIRAHNLKAKENKRKRAEKEERERDARKRMGIQGPIKNDVGPSQLRLGAFMGVRKRPKKDQLSSPKTPPEDLETFEPVTNCPEPKDSLSQEIIKLDGASLKSATARLCSPPATLVIATTCTPPRHSIKKEHTPQPCLMLPPPRPPVKRICSSTMLQPSLKPPRKVPVLGVETDWDLFLDSNTQVEREISDIQVKPPFPVPCHKPGRQTSRRAPMMDSTDFLNGISTQDLQYCSSPPPTTTIVSNDDAEYACEIDDEDLSTLTEVAVLECCAKAGDTLVPPLPSTPHEECIPVPFKTHQSTSSSANRCSIFRTDVQSVHTETFSRIGATAQRCADEFDDYEMSSQELRELVC
ncbi:MAG: hypothetical protein Q9166_003166 [cf. Caloplaca sp. 2 TL-2023]